MNELNNPKIEFISNELDFMYNQVSNTNKEIILTIQNKLIELDEYIKDLECENPMLNNN